MEMFFPNEVVIPIMGLSFSDLGHSQAQLDHTLMNSIVHRVSLHAWSFQLIESDPISEPCTELFDGHGNGSHSSHPVTHFLLNLFLFTI